MRAFRFLLGIVWLCFVISLCAGCNASLSEQKAAPSEELFAVKISVTTDGGTPRVLLPDALIKENLFYSLAYKKNSEANYSRFPSSGAAVSYASFFAETLYLAGGTYSFSLYAYSSAGMASSMLPMLSETVSQSIAADSAALSFSLAEPTDGKGGVSFAFTLSSSDVSQVAVKLMTLPDVGGSSSVYGAESVSFAGSATASSSGKLMLTPSGTSINALYEAQDIPRGYYICYITLTNSAGSETVIPEAVYIASGRTVSNASSPLILTDAMMNTRYTLTLCNADGTGTEVPYQTFVKNQTVQLPAPTAREWFAFCGWYETSDYSGPAFTAYMATTAANKKLYAKWCPLTVYVSAVGSDSNRGTTESDALFTLAEALQKVNTLSAAESLSSYDWRIAVTGSINGSTTISTLSAASLTIEGQSEGLDEHGKPYDVLQGNTSDTVLTLNTTVPVTLDGLYINGGMRGILVGQTGASATIRRTHVSDNFGSSSTPEGGAGILIRGSDCTITISEGFITSNYTEKSGGGIMVTGANCRLSIVDSVIEGNTAYFSGAGICFEPASGGELNIDDSSIIDNTLSTSSDCIAGGGIFFSSGKLTAHSMILNENFAYGDGAGLYASGSNITEVSITGGSISENEVQAGNGGGIYIVAENGISYTFTSVSIDKNSVTEGNGGGAYCSSSGQVAFYSCTFEENELKTNGKQGGGIFNTCTTILQDCAVRNNTAAQGAGIRSTASVYVGGSTIFSSDNDIFLFDFPLIYVTSALTQAAPIAHLAFSNYQNLTQVLALAPEAPSSLTLAAVCDKFAVLDDLAGNHWTISTEGKLLSSSAP